MCVRAATVPDHVVALEAGGPDTWANLQPLCEDCHTDKTAEDLGYKRKPTIGLDGWPEESK